MLRYKCTIFKENKMEF